jgi:hypothetical protein
MPKSIDVGFIIEQFSDYKDGDNIVCSEKTFREIIETKSILKKKKPKCSYFVWLGEHRNNIRDEYFSDFDKVIDWSLDNKKEYYSSKELPLDKVVKDGRPRIVSLITTKAGILWKALSDEEKAVYEQKAIELKDNCEVVEVHVVEKKKRGRPKKQNHSNNISDAVVEKYHKDTKKNNDKSSDEIKVEEIMYKDKKYYLDINNNDIYDPDTSEIVGKKIGKNININININ